MLGDIPLEFANLLKHSFLCEVKYPIYIVRLPEYANYPLVFSIEVVNVTWSEHICEFRLKMLVKPLAEIEFLGEFVTRSRPKAHLIILPIDLRVNTDLSPHKPPNLRFRYLLDEKQGRIRNETVVCSCLFRRQSQWIA